MPEALGQQEDTTMDFGDALGRLLSSGPIYGTLHSASCPTVVRRRDSRDQRQKREQGRSRARRDPARGRRCRFRRVGDVRVKSDMDGLLAESARRFGGVDIVVPNAGGNDDEARNPAVRGRFADIDLDRVTRFIEQAFAAKLLVVQSALPYLRERGGGSVVFVTSGGGRVPTPGQTAIATFSGGLIQASKLLAKELAPLQIRVNCVCVTVVRDSPSWNATFEREDGVALQHRTQYEKIIERAPFGVAAPHDVGNVVAFLASNDAHYLTGAIVSPTGGLTVH
jgi:2-hydroxycyclohexanecarboxyl-CoA dehydrogenase